MLKNIRKFIKKGSFRPLCGETNIYKYLKGKPNNLNLKGRLKVIEFLPIRFVPSNREYRIWEWWTLEMVNIITSWKESF